MQLLVIASAVICMLAYSKPLWAQTVQFPYASSSVNIGDLDVAGNQITVEALIYLEKNTTGGDIVSKHVNRTNVNYLLRPLTFELTTYLSGNSGETRYLQLFNPQKLALNRWYHIAGTYDGGSVRYYVNGCLVVDTAFSGNLYQNDFVAAIGNMSNCECEQFSGKIDEVRVWKVARTQRQIVQNMLTLPAPSQEQGLLACYSFSNNYINEQGNPLWNGTAVGTAAFSLASAMVDQRFQVTGIQADNADCERVHNGAITVYANQADAVFSLDGLRYQAANQFPALQAGNYKIYAKDTAGCLFKNDVTVGNSHLFVPLDLSASLCRQRGYLGYTSAGTYVDTIRAASGCDTLRTVHIAASLKSFVSNSKTICEGDSYLGHRKTGQYADTLVGVNGCDSINILSLTVATAPQPDLGNNRAICKGDSIHLSPGKFDTYLWQDGSSKDYLPITGAGIYAVQVGNACGSARQEVVIADGLCGLFFPTAFTPNGDGVNDVFRPAMTNLANFQWKIYNRFGQLIFDAKQNIQGWDGRVNGQLQNPGVYVWSCSFTKNNQTEVKNGSLVLIR